MQISARWPQAAHLVLPISFVIYTLLFTALILVLEIFTSYKVFSNILKYLAVTLLAYPVTLFIIHLPLLTVLEATFIPHFHSHSIPLHNHSRARNDYLPVHVLLGSVAGSRGGKGVGTDR